MEQKKYFVSHHSTITELINAIMITLCRKNKASSANIPVMKTTRWKCLDLIFVEVKRMAFMKVFLVLAENE